MAALAAASTKDELLDDIQNTLLSTKQNPFEVETEINNVFNTLDSIIDDSKFDPKENVVIFFTFSGLTTPNDW